MTPGSFWHSQNDPTNPYQNDPGVILVRVWGHFGKGGLWSKPSPKWPQNWGGVILTPHFRDPHLQKIAFQRTPDTTNVISPPPYQKWPQDSLIQKWPWLVRNGQNLNNMHEWPKFELHTKNYTDTGIFEKNAFLRPHILEK